MMKLTILGRGTLCPRLDAGGPGHLLEAGDQKILFETGLGTLHKLLKLGIDLRKINHIFYSHTHNDHTCELAPLLWYLQFLLKFRPEDPKNDTIRINLYGPKGFKEYFNTVWFKILEKEELMPFIESVNELGSGETHVDNIKITSEPVDHKRETIGFRVEHQGRIFVYSGDTSICDGLKKIAANADLLLLECAFTKVKSVKGHMNTVECGRVAKESGAKKIVLTHMYPETLDSNVKEECATEFDGEIIVAEDLMSIKI